MSGERVKRRWRFYVSASGRRVVDEFVDGLSDGDAAEVHAAMRDVRQSGLRIARHLRGEIYEVRAEGADNSYRMLFASEGKKGRILLGLHVIEKRTQKTPPREIELAERRLADWHRRARR